MKRISTTADNPLAELLVSLAGRWELRLAEGSGPTRDALDCGRTLQLMECLDELRAELYKLP